MYKSKHEAYTFLSDPPEDLRCDFEILTDEIASMTGLLRAIINNKVLQNELLFVCELIYHINPTLRTKLTVTRDEFEQLQGIVKRLEDEVGDVRKQFLLPCGNEFASLAHILRARCKNAVRLLYRYAAQGNSVDDLLLDITNLLSGYFFVLAVKLNILGGVDEVTFTSRNYTIK